MDVERDEYELARRARDGDREALSELVERARLRLFAQAFADLRHYDDAQDVVAAALLRICRYIGELREPERVRAWMQSIVRNEARRRLWRRSGEPMSLPDMSASPAETGPSLLRLDVELALRRLPRDQARALALFYLDRRPIEEIARLTGRPDGTIKRWLHLGRRLLATEMEDYAPMTTTTTPTATPTATATPSGTTATLSAAIISSEFDPTRLAEFCQTRPEEERLRAAPRSLRQLVEALEEAGFVDVTTFDDLQNLVNPEMGEDGTRHWNLAPALKGKQLIVLNDTTRGHSAFEILTVLKAVPELQGAKFFLLLSNPRDFTVLAAWCIGVDCLLTTPMDIQEFTNFGGRLRRAIEEGRGP